MEALSKQKPMKFRLFAFRCCHSRSIICATALMVILLLLPNGCYGDQIERDHDDIDTTSTSQVQFKKHHQRQAAANFNLTLQHNRLLARDETIKNDDKAATVAAATSKPSSSSLSSSSLAAVAPILINKSDRSVKSNGQTTTAASAVKTTTNYRFVLKRDLHRSVHQSRNLNGNAAHRNRFIQYQDEFKNTSDARHHRDRDEQPFDHQPLQRVSHSSKPKIISKLSTATTDQRTKTYLSVNLVRDNVQKTRERFIPTAGEQQQQPQLQPIYSTQIKQTNNNNDVYKSFYRPIHRKHCNKCRIIPGVPIRYKPYPRPTKVRYHGMYT